MKKRDLIAHLREHGCDMLRDTGPHEIWWKPPDRRTITPVPRHTEIADGTARGICRRLGIPPPPK